jgi:hypothetical protein
MNLGEKTGEMIELEPLDAVPPAIETPVYAGLVAETPDPREKTVGHLAPVGTES